MFALVKSTSFSLGVWVGILNLIASIPVLSFLLVLIFDYPFFSAHQEPGIKAHMLNRVSFYEALPGVLGIQGEGLFIFRDLGRRAIYFQGFGEFLEF